MGAGRWGGGRTARRDADGGLGATDPGHVATGVGLDGIGVRGPRVLGKSCVNGGRKVRYSVS